LADRAALVDFHFHLFAGIYSFLNGIKPNLWNPTGAQRKIQFLKW